MQHSSSTLDGGRVAVLCCTWSLKNFRPRDPLLYARLLRMVQWAFVHKILEKFSMAKNDQVPLQ